MAPGNPFKGGAVPIGILANPEIARFNIRSHLFFKPPKAGSNPNEKKKPKEKPKTYEELAKKENLGI